MFHAREGERPVRPRRHLYEDRDQRRDGRVLYREICGEWSVDLSLEVSGTGGLPDYVWCLTSVDCWMLGANKEFLFFSVHRLLLAARPAK